MIETSVDWNGRTPSRAYHKKRDGILMIEVDGRCRFLTTWERVKLFFGVEPA